MLLGFTDITPYAIYCRLNGVQDHNASLDKNFIDATLDRNLIIKFGSQGIILLNRIQNYVLY